QWDATYDGDANNKSTFDPGLTSEQTAVSQASPAINTVPGAMVTIGSGAKLNDSATLSSGYNPGGSITFYLFAPGVTPNGPYSNNVYSNTVVGGGNGTYSTRTGTNPGGYTPTVIGTYQWVAVYSGDSNNKGATDGFGSEPETVVAPNLVITKVADASTVTAD